MTSTAELPHELLRRVRVRGFRSLRDVTVELTDVTVLIGPNGSGKSNLLSVLRMVPLMRTQSLRQFVRQQGGASGLLHYGPSVTRELSIRLDYEVEGGTNSYDARLGYAAGDTLLFLDEQAEYRKQGAKKPQTVSLGAGHAESALGEAARYPANKTERFLDRLLSLTYFYHFHDTSATSPLRQNAPAADDWFLRSDGANLAAFLFRMRTSDAPDTRAAWRVLAGLIRQIAPFVKELVPDLSDPENPHSARRLFWIDDRDHRFDAHELSDGTLRAIALFAALTQPAATLPKFISIDEPELGLHPAALSLFAGVVRSAAPRCQIVLSTQSPALLDEFTPEEVIVTERVEGATQFRRLARADLEAWLDDYSLSQLYDKNVLGGRP